MHACAHEHTQRQNSPRKQENDGKTTAGGRTATWVFRFRLSETLLCSSHSSVQGPTTEQDGSGGTPHATFTLKPESLSGFPFLPKFSTSPSIKGKQEKQVFCHTEEIFKRSPRNCHVARSDDPSAMTKACLTMDVLRANTPLCLGPLVHSLPVFLLQRSSTAFLFFF